MISLSHVHFLVKCTCYSQQLLNLKGKKHCHAAHVNRVFTKRRSIFTRFFSPQKKHNSSIQYRFDEKIVEVQPELFSTAISCLLMFYEGGYCCLHIVRWTTAYFDGRTDLFRNAAKIKVIKPFCCHNCFFRKFFFSSILYLNITSSWSKCWNIS